MQTLLRKLFQDQLNKFTQKRFVQNLIIEIIADLVMLIGGLVIGYYLRTMLF